MMEDSFVFASVLSDEEWKTVPEELGKKILKFVTGNFDEFIKSKALLETRCTNLEKEDKDAQLALEKAELECKTLKAKLEVAANTITEHENQLSNLSAETTKLRLQCNTLEAETAEYRQQRNQAVDERDEHLLMINRRNGAIERLQSDLNTLTKQLESAVNAKCEALTQIDEVASMKLNLEYREKRIEQERSLLSSQMESLTEEVNQRTEELLNMRRDNTSLCIQLESKLIQKTQELTVATEQIKSLTDLNTNLTARIEELSQKMFSQREEEAKVNESYVYEIEAKTKMADAFKSRYDELEQHNNVLKEAFAEVQQVLKNATEEYGELETKYKESQLANEEIIEKKNACIELLKKELETANELMDTSRPVLGGEDLSPSVSASTLPKSGMTYSELYSRYVNVSNRLAETEEELAKANNYIDVIVNELSSNAPKLRKLKEDYAESLSTIDSLKDSNDQLSSEIQQLLDANSECKKAVGIQTRENERLRKEVTDLSRQVVTLLTEVENSRIGSSSTSTDNDLSDSINSADVISKKLVTFTDVSELHTNNLKLLTLVRELSARQEEVESLDPAAIAALKLKVEELTESQNELLEEREKQTKMMATLRNQKDMYKNLYTQVVKGAGEEVHMSDASENGEPKIRTETETQLEEKVHEYEAKVEKLTKEVEHLKEENETYRKEKSANEKILLEQLESMRGEVKELTRLNCKLSSNADLNEEKFKILNNNIEIYKKQITALEKQNKIYSESIIKHEQAATYLKDETIQSQTKLSRAEVMLGSLQKENALLKDAEQRLVKERDSLKRDSYQQNLIKSNIELIKATLERTDAEGKLKLEARLDEAYRECAALRRRLQEEQDHFRQLSDHLSAQNKTAEKRAEEEREIAEKLRKEVAETREELMAKVAQNEELTKKLKSELFMVPDGSAETRKVRELEQQISDLQAEIESLKKKLKTSKDASDEYFKVAEASEKQVKDAMSRNESLIKEIDKQKSRILELEEKCAELEGEISIQLDDQDITNAGKSRSLQLQEELNIRNLDLKTAKQQLENARSENKQLIEQLKAVENKYAREVTLHSVDLQSLTNMKEELDKALGEVNKLQSERQKAVDALEQFKSDWEKQEQVFQNEKQELEGRFKDMDSQNTLLHDQIQALNTQLIILQGQVNDNQNQNTSIGDSSFSKSFTEDETKSSEQLLKIIKYLRQEKDIAVSKADIVEAEHSRLKSQFEMVNKQFEEAKSAIEAERQKTEISVVSAAKHSEVLRKLETLNAITDSNRTLRQERDTLASQLAELRSRAETFETEVEPLQEKNRELTTKADQLQSENISLRAECTRWRQRANMLIEKTNRTSPEDWKKLQTERETLAKQLTIERANITKLNDDVNTLKQEKGNLEEKLSALKNQSTQQQEQITRLREEVSNLQAQVTQLTNTVDQQSAEIIKFKEDNRALTDDTTAKDGTINELKNNLAQVRKIAKKYKIQCEDQTKEIDSLKQQNQQHESEQMTNVEKQELLETQRSELEEKINELEKSHKEVIDQLNQEVSSTTEQIDNYKKEIDTLKHASQEKEERFKGLFKNAKDRIVSLTEQINNLKEEVNRQGRSDGGEKSSEDSKKIAELLEKISVLEREKDDILEEKQQEQDKHATEIETLNQRISQLQRQLGLQQGSKPSTSSSTVEKSSTERPTADIKPMAGHSTNTQTQSVPIQPWRSGGEPPLASIRPMSAQIRTVAVLPTSQSPSAVMVPPQQQVHTTGSSSIEALSSSPTSSHTEYVPATSSASPAMLGPRQVAVPPTQSSQDTEDDENSMQVQAAPQTQAVALVLPRVEPPSSGPTQEQGTSSSSSNTVTTTQAGHKRQREADMDSSQSDEQNKAQQQTKRTRIQQAGTVSDSGLDVEYQVPTSSQRDHDDDNVIVVESDEEGGADEGEGADDEQDDPDTEGYDMEGMEQDNYEDADCQDVEDEEEAGNEVEVIDDSSEVPNQSEREEQDNVEEESSEQPQSEAISSGTDGTGRSVPTTPLQSSPQEGIPGSEEQSTSQMTQSDAEIPSITISGEVDDNETRGEGSSGDMGPPGVAGTSSEGAQQHEEAEEMLEGDDGVSSEGEKPPVAEEGEEEGREAEASPSSNSRGSARGSNSARRSLRTSLPRSVNQRSGPTPIVWGDRSPQRHQHSQDRRSPSAYQSRTVARRARGRIQRPFDRRF